MAHALEGFSVWLVVVSVILVFVRGAYANDTSEE